MFDNGGNNTSSADSGSTSGATDGSTGADPSGAPGNGGYGFGNPGPGLDNGSPDAGSPATTGPDTGGLGDLGSIGYSTPSQGVSIGAPANPTSIAPSNADIAGADLATGLSSYSMPSMPADAGGNATSNIQDPAAQQALADALAAPAPGYSLPVFAASPGNMGGLSSQPGDPPAGITSNTTDMVARLTALGATPEGAAGFVGAMTGESGMGLNPTIINPQSGAYGIAQDLGPRLTTLQSQPDFQTYGVQADNVVRELQTTESTALTQLLGATTTAQGVAAGLAFERPGPLSQAQMDLRQNNADTIAGYLAGGAIADSFTQPVTGVAFAPSAFVRTDFASMPLSSAGAQMPPNALEAPSAPVGPSLSQIGGAITRVASLASNMGVAAPAGDGYYGTSGIGNDPLHAAIASSPTDVFAYFAAPASAGQEIQLTQATAPTPAPPALTLTKAQTLQHNPVTVMQGVGAWLTKMTGG